ncbi:hypothetical protein BABINDRAFT_160841 [Babjeviella inositovora NRRL Y-12698]|uniref:Prenyltransferase alpha-alpha toroid domain-containing protein n=1 Tax=Babjeviella inositovora NRRL Y-12698 TaxID=984486 RepID=A0A1E3QSA6_9ASCO|nr:uncharacterized protein BABINDRAFT_160841 [Babjeviella inositovora NRRL Y-12698]ODQ80579.1 hypothetical protein BABINDRAFT_160841 [Babjeviella inositovora NRRL Y-12698]
MPTSELTFLKEKHIKYFVHVLSLCPHQFQSEDSNKLAMVYFALTGLTLANPSDNPLEPFIKTENERLGYVEFIYKHLVPSGEGFRGSMTMELPASEGSTYDPPNLPATYFALCCLLILKEDYTKRLDRHKIMNYVRRCQVDEGYFRPTLDMHGSPFGDSDMRHCQIISSIRMMLGYTGGENDIDCDALEAYILSTVSYDGGIGNGAGEYFTESHAGLAFCGLFTLKALGRLTGEDPRWNKTKRWLHMRQMDYDSSQIHRQVELDENEYAYEEDHGGFNGRENKYTDTCYAFWVLGCLRLLSNTGDLLIDERALAVYLLGQTQHQFLGGFGKTNEDMPDPLHSTLGLAALSHIQHSAALDGLCVEKLHLGELDDTLVVDKQSKVFLDGLKW